ncbi:MAG: L-aspartate oxidase [Sedimentisphaerales bacterium]|nr:L-aspartate oxidase [Sedimentisphaerales bacterium]
MVVRAPIEIRRYLARMDTDQLGHLYTDTLVIGGGVAGLRASLEAAKAGSVLVLVKDQLTESNTYHAQGGIAAVLLPDDTFESHIDDTLRTGCGLCRPEVVELVVKQAPDHIRQLLEWSTPFDMVNGQIQTGREGGHSHTRIAHALGDATGKAVAQCLIKQVKKQRAIKVFEECFCMDLLTRNGECLGVICYHPRHGWQCIWARRTILASGGAGRLWRETTNPVGATADGLAMAYRAGAILTDLEFMQFHPTTLYIAGASRTLITEALRGAGACLVNNKSERFMSQYHEQGDLAPRDVVSRAIYDQLAHTDATHVYLDVRHLGVHFLAEHFPTISALCQSFDIDVAEDLIPVRPSAHYMVGGVKTDIQGRTNIINLYCCGEAAATGLHGSNRLASNSLLEGMVFGKICGETVAREIAGQPGRLERHRIVFEVDESKRTKLDIPDVTNSLRAVMWRNAGIVRNGQRLEETIEIIDFWQRYIMDKVFDDPVSWQCQNMLTICRLIARAALQRQESRGVHYRSDYPQPEDDKFKHHIDISLK